MAKSKKPEKEDVLKRSIYFYKLRTSDDASDIKLFNIQAALRHIKDLSFIDETAYEIVEDDNALACWIDETEVMPYRLKFGISKRNGHPLVDRSGILSKIQMPASAGLAFYVHVVFFENNILGSEFDFFSPRVQRLSYFFKKKLPTIFPEVYLQPLLNKDVVSKIRNMEKITLFTFKSRLSKSEFIKEANSDIFNAIDEARKFSRCEEVEITMSAKGRDGYLEKDTIVGFINSLFKFGVKSEEIPKMKIKGSDFGTNKVDIVNLLNNKLVSSSEIIVQDKKTRALNDESAYNAIIGAFESLKDFIKEAAGD